VVRVWPPGWVPVEGVASFKLKMARGKKEKEFNFHPKRNAAALGTTPQQVTQKRRKKRQRRKRFSWPKKGGNINTQKGTAMTQGIPLAPEEESNLKGPARIRNHISLPGNEGNQGAIKRKGTKADNIGRGGQPPRKSYHKSTSKERSA